MRPPPSGQERSIASGAGHRAEQRLSPSLRKHRFWRTTDARPLVAGTSGGRSSTWSVAWYLKFLHGRPALVVANRTICGKPSTAGNHQHTGCAVVFHAFTSGGFEASNCTKTNRPHGGASLSLPSPRRHHARVWALSSVDTPRRSVIHERPSYSSRSDGPCRR